MSDDAELAKWMGKLGYLPELMRDFHDGKDVFKAVHEIINANETAEKIGFLDGMIYTIDVFLWFMAQRGYTLQRCRKDLPFRDIHADVQEATEHRRQRMNELLKSDLAAARSR